MAAYFDRVERAAIWLRSRLRDVPDVAVVLGSGLSPFADSVRGGTRVSYEQIPEWPVSAVLGHPGYAVAGAVAGRRVLALAGRVHAYEGHDPLTVTFGVHRPDLGLFSYHQRMLPTIEWQRDVVVMIDQRKLPGQEIYVHCKTPGEVARAIKTMVIRGAPAIGVAAAMGLALGVRKSRAQGTRQLAVEFNKQCAQMAGTRPTAVNLFWAIDRMKATFAAGAQSGESVAELAARLEREALAIHDEDVRSCRDMGRFGADVVPATGRVLTHCNAGALATAGYGTALGVIRAAAEQGKITQVYADETRPFLQGARLTAWELVRDGVPTTVIAESMAGPLMRRGQVDVVVVGADRIAANGDAANKIGTYTVALLASAHGVPFYVAAPLSTVDLATPNGDGIPIEERPAREMTHAGTARVVPEGASVWNPAFDVTPAPLIAGIITEKGIARPPFTESLPALFARARAAVTDAAR